MEGLEPKTDREIMMVMASGINAQNTKIDGLTDAVERIAIVIEKLETNKIGSIEKRLGVLEKWYNEWGGVLKLVTIASLVLGIITALAFWFKHG
jgi:hypothetical protein